MKLVPIRIGLDNPNVKKALAKLRLTGNPIADRERLGKFERKHGCRLVYGTPSYLEFNNPIRLKGFLNSKAGQ